MIVRQVHHTLTPVSKSREPVFREPVFREPIAWMRLLTTTALFSILTGSLLVALESRRSVGALTTDAAQTTAGPESPLGLKVTFQEQRVEIRWNHESRAMLGAPKGLVKITDGKVTEFISLDRRDLRDGHVSYTPITKDVSICFEVIAADGTSVTESARAVR
jgi:hypothetical protein